jgi:hypothetical protein
VSLRSLEAAAAYPAKALQLIATAAAWRQQQQQQGDVASRKSSSSTTKQAAAVCVCLAAAQELLPHMSASSIAQLLVSMAALQLVDPALLQPAQQTAAIVPEVELGLLLELAARELAAGRNRGWLLQQQQQQQPGMSLSEVAAACKVLSMSAAAMARLGLE